MNQKNSVMSLQDNPCKWVLPLQHMARVKTVEVLWRNSVYRNELKYLHANSLLKFKHYQVMSENLGKNLDALRIPELMMKDLKVSMMEMINIAVEWLIHMFEDVRKIEPVEQNHVVMFSYFVDNFSWLNSGRVDGRGMLQSYVRNKETVDFYTWKQLCDYCIEDDIIRFSETIDWPNCQGFMSSFSHCLVWYFKIHQEFPTKEMFSSEQEYTKFEEMYHGEGAYNTDWLIEDMLHRSALSGIFPAGLAAIKYFRNQRAFEEQVHNIFLSKQMDWAPRETVVYMFEQIGKGSDPWLERIFTDLPSLFGFLMEWPENMLIDHWMHILEDPNILPQHFLNIFRIMRSPVCMWRESGLNESQFPLLANRLLYKPFKDLYGLFRRKFVVDNDLASKTVDAIFITYDITLCNIVLNELEPSQRKYCLNRLPDLLSELLMEILRDCGFWTEFLKEVLKSDEEREIFRKMDNDRPLVDNISVPADMRPLEICKC